MRCHTGQRLLIQSLDRGIKRVKGWQPGMRGNMCIDSPLPFVYSIAIYCITGKFTIIFID